MSKYHIDMAIAGGANLTYFSTYRNGFYPELVIRHFKANDQQFLLIERLKKTVDLVTFKDVGVREVSLAAELIFESQSNQNKKVA